MDLRKEKVIIFNDRYRMQRVYYHEDRNSFYFSSEAKALLKIKPDLRSIDMRSLGQFFSCGCVLQDRSLFSNVSILPGGSAWTFSNGKCQKNENYFKPSSWESQPVLRKEKFYEKLKDMFPKILTRYFRTKNPISISLTSGLDTRMILSCLDNSFGRFPCYTFSGMYLDSLDARIARKVAEACRYNHDIIRLDRNFLAHFSNYAEKTIYVTDGCHDICGTHDIYLNKLAREIAPIRMTGKFGSEVLRDLSQLKAISIGNQLFHPDFQKHVTKAVRTLNEIKKGNDLTFAVFKEMPLHEFGCLAIEQSQLTVRTPYMDNALVELVYRAPAKTRSSAEVPLRLIKDKSPELFKIMTDRGTAGTPNNISSKLAQIFYYFLFKTEYVYLYQLPHWLGKIDYRFSPFNAENLILGRYQLGHYRIWFRNELSDYVREILLDRRAVNRPYLNKKLLEDMVNRHISGERNYLREINKLMTVEMIHRLLIEDI